MTLRDYLFEYIYNKGNSIEQEEVDLKNCLRLSALDDLDHFRLQFSREQPRMCVTLKSRRIREKER